MKMICIGTNEDLEKEYLRLTGVIFEINLFNYMDKTIKFIFNINYSHQRLQ